MSSLICYGYQDEQNLAASPPHVGHPDLAVGMHVAVPRHWSSKTVVAWDLQIVFGCVHS